MQWQITCSSSLQSASLVRINMTKTTNEILASKKENLKWTNRMDELFFEAMLYEQAQGNRPDGTFTTLAYANMLKYLIEKLEIPSLKKSHLLNRQKTLKAHFAECYDLFKCSLSGFAWSSVTKKWDAEHEVWKDLIEAKPKAAIWRDKAIYHYDRLEELFAKDRATGDGSVTAKEKRKKWDHMAEQGSTIVGIDGAISRNEVTLESFNLDATDDFISTPSQAPSQEPFQVPVESVITSKEKKKKVKHFDDEGKLTNVVDKLVTILEKQGEAFINSSVRVYSANDIFKGLTEMNFEEETIDEAYLWLLENQDKARAVFGLPLERRLNFLKNLMNNHH